MKEKHKELEKILEQEISQHIHAHDGGGKLTPQSAKALSDLTVALIGQKILCLMYDIKEKGLAKVLGGEHEGKQPIGFNPTGEHTGWGGAWPQMIRGIMPPSTQPLMPVGEHAEHAYARRGVPGTGRGRRGRRGGARSEMEMEYTDAYDEDDSGDDEHDWHEAEGRRGVPGSGRRRSRRTGRFIRGEHDIGTDEHDMRSEMRDAVRSELRAEHERRAEFERAVHDAVGRGPSGATPTHIAATPTHYNPTHLAMPHSAMVHGAVPRSDTTHSETTAEHTGAIGPSGRR